jgi:ankyrin repeat protein
MGRLIRCGFQDCEWSDLDTLANAVIDDPLVAYAYHSWATHARNSWDDPTVAFKVKQFVRGCHSFLGGLPVDWHGASSLALYDGTDTGRPRRSMAHRRRDASGRNDIELFGPLHVAAHFNLPLSFANSTLINNLNPNARTSQNKSTALHLACSRPSSLNTLKELLALKLIRVNATNKWKETPLIRAVICSNIGAVKLLLDRPNTELDPQDKEGLTAFTRAARMGDRAIVRAILAHSPAEIYATDGHGRTALSRACEDGHLAMVELLVSHSRAGVTVRLACNNGRTPLSYAASSNCVDTFKCVLAVARDDVQLADKAGRTPLGWASQCGRETIVKILLDYPGTNVNQVDYRGCAPLHRAVWTTVQTTQALLATPNIDVNLADNAGRTPLLNAILGGKTEIVMALLAHPQVNVNLPDNTSGRTPLILAVKLHCRQVVELLLAHPDIKVNLPDRKGQTPLIWHSMQDHDEYHPLLDLPSTRALLAHPQIDVNLADDKGQTALSWASKRGHRDIVKLLLEHPQINVPVELGHPFGRLLDSVGQRIQGLWDRPTPARAHVTLNLKTSWAFGS